MTTNGVSDEEMRARYVGGYIDAETAAELRAEWDSWVSEHDREVARRTLDSEHTRKHSSLIAEGDSDE